MHLVLSTIAVFSLTTYVGGFPCQLPGCSARSLAHFSGFTADRARPVTRTLPSGVARLAGGGGAGEFPAMEGGEGEGFEREVQGTLFKYGPKGWHAAFESGPPEGDKVC